MVESKPFDQPNSNLTLASLSDPLEQDCGTFVDDTASIASIESDDRYTYILAPNSDDACKVTDDTSELIDDAGELTDYASKQTDHVHKLIQAEEDNSYLTPVELHDRYDDVSDEEQIYMTKPFALPVKQKFNYELDCKSMEGGKHWLIGSTIGSVGVYHKAMSPRECLLPLTHLEAKAWCAALRQWAPWFRMVDATVTCHTTMYPSACRLLHEICSNVEGTALIGIQSNVLTLKFSSKLQSLTHHPFDPGI